VDPDPGFDDPKLEKCSKNKFFFEKMKFLGTPGTESLAFLKGRPSYRSIQPSKESIQHFKKLNLLTFSHICGSILPSWILIQGPH
jgi:hypothetical protein